MSGHLTPAAARIRFARGIGRSVSDKASTPLRMSVARVVNGTRSVRYYCAINQSALI